MSAATDIPRSLVTLRARGPLATLDDVTRRTITDRTVSGDPTVSTRTAAAIERVRTEGDAALRDFALAYDGIVLEQIEVPRAQWTQALATLDPLLRDALERAARNITAVHAAFLPRAVEVESEPGVLVGRRPDPLGRVGVYAPGGRAAYPSSLLMGAIPARVAGVSEVIVCSPPGPNGMPSQVVLAAAALANVDRLFAIGGAGAIAAMALGTATVPQVDRIVGPGNAYVAEAKLQLVKSVAIDSPAGPSELLVLADESASPLAIARELLAQAEHDPDAAVIAVLVGTSAPAQLAEVESALATLLETAPRAEIVRIALAARGAIVTTASLAEAIAFSNSWAAEHLLLVVNDASREHTLAALRNAGTIFVGESSAVAFGDYMTGANHVLPTAGAARCYSGLSTLDFVRWTTWQRVSPEAAASLSESVAYFADAEGLPGHAAAARAWTNSAVVAVESAAQRTVTGDNA